jgi:3-oxoacyl-[acyl-carrier protein] reductase/(S)-1-phenylethanol dehydrogenase
VQGIKAAGGSAIAVQCDISDPASVAKLKAEVEQNGRRCDILINNAGIYPMQSFDEITFEDWRRVLSVNLDSMFLMAKAFAGGMRQRGWGRIINLASDTVNLLVPDFVHYITSKAGVIGFTRSLATELGPQGVTVSRRRCSRARPNGSVSRSPQQGIRRPQRPLRHRFGYRQERIPGSRHRCCREGSREKAAAPWPGAGVL